MIVVAIIALAIGLGVGLKSDDNDGSKGKEVNPDEPAFYENGAVATDAYNCSIVSFPFCNFFPKLYSINSTVVVFTEFLFVLDLVLSYYH